jgi:DNA modification methylase
MTADPIHDLAIERRSPGDLRPAGRKSRHHPAKQMAAIRKSIETFGFVSPVLIDGKNGILAGNARVEAAKALGLVDIPVVVVDHLTPEQQRAFVLADNRLAELGSWNREVLQLELQELSSLEVDFSLEVTGFSLPEIDAICFGPGSDSEPGEAIPDVKETPTCQVGDLWLLGPHKLLIGDATSPEALDRLLDGESVRLVFTDPPYNVPIAGHVTSNKAHGEFVQASGEMSDEAFTGFLTQVAGQVTRALVDGGLAYLCMDWRHMANTLAAGASAKLALLNLCVWDKGVGGMGSFYRSQHELVFVFKHGAGKHANRVELGKHGRNRSNIWSYEGVSGFGADKARERAMHPTVKPLALVRDALLDASDKGDLVLDLFGGSGTTLIAAERTGRRARLMELDPRYGDVIIRRWQDLTGQLAVHAQSGRTLDQAKAAA